MKCAYDEGMKAEVFDTVDRIGRESMDLLSDDVKKARVEQACALLTINVNLELES